MNDPFVLLRSDNRDVERAQLNKILRRLADLAAQGGGGDAGGDIDGGNASTIFTDTDPILDGGGA